MPWSKSWVIWGLKKKKKKGHKGQKATTRWPQLQLSRDQLTRGQKPNSPTNQDAVWWMDVNRYTEAAPMRSAGDGLVIPSWTAGALPHRMHKGVFWALVRSRDDVPVREVFTKLDETHKLVVYSTWHHKGRVAGATCQQKIVAHCDLFPISEEVWWHTLREAYVWVYWLHQMFVS